MYCIFLQDFGGYGGNNSSLFSMNGIWVSFAENNMMETHFVQLASHLPYWRVLASV